MRNDNPLAQRQPVGLDDGGEGAAPQIGKGGGRVGKHPVVGGGNAVVPHEIFGEYLAALNAGGLGAGPEAGNAQGAEPVRTAQSQRVVRPHHGKVNGVGGGEGGDAVQVPGGNLHADGVRRNAAVSRQSEDGFHRRAFPQLLNNGVLAAPAADNEKIHKTPPSRF